jgi:hypothetical protein
VDEVRVSFDDLYEYGTCCLSQSNTFGFDAMESEGAVWIVILNFSITGKSEGQREYRMVYL